MAEKLLKVRWNAHQSNQASYFGTLFSTESFVDVTLVSSEGKKIMCHKIILSSCSPYFQSVFESNPCKHPIVILKDVQYDDLKTIITFIYNGEVNISQDNINSILSTAASLQVKGLADVPTGDNKKGVRKRDGDSHRSQLPTLLTSTSSTSGETEDSSTALQGADIPRKKLKKSVTVSGSISTNGEPSGGGSFESGVGASINRSVDDGSNSAGGSDNRNDGPPARILSSLSASFHPTPGKSQSLDQSLLDRDREPVLVDSELSSGGFSENQTFDEATMGDERAGYEIDDLADVKIEADTDGEIEFEDDEDEESFGPDNPEFNELNQSNLFPNIPSSSSYYQPVHHFASSRMRRRVKYPKFPGDGNAVVTNSKYEQAIADLVQNPALTFREAAQRYSLNASSVWYHYRMKYGYRRKVEYE